MIFAKLETLKKQEQQLKVELMKLKVLAQQLSFSPHLNVPIRVYREGSRWVCVFECDPEPLNCVMAYGESPAQACSNFDALWNGAPGFVIEDQEDEEEQF